MSVAELLAAVQQEVAHRAYVRRIEILDQTPSLVKVRLLISGDLFIQIYRNDRFDTTNLVLIYNGQRKYARDQVNGIWHRHPADDPAAHDSSPDGRQEVDLTQFLDEIETVLADLGLP